MKPQKSETDLLYAFMVKAPTVLSHVRVFRRNIVNLPSSVDGRTFRARSGTKGQADAYAILRGGQHVEIETKAAAGKLADAQRAWRAFCESWGIPHLVLRAKRGEAPEATVDRWIAELRAVVGPILPA